jgi:hypothetical protein
MMYRRIAITASFGILLIGSSAAWAQATRPSPQLLVFGEPRGEQPAPSIVRGSTAEPAAAPASPARNGERWQIVAGKRLWLVERESGEVRACTDRDTSTVGVREIRCTSGELGRYARSFGRDFNP